MLIENMQRASPVPLAKGAHPMSQVNEILIDLVDKVIDQLAISEESFDRVQEIILENYLPLDDSQAVIEYFRDIVLCSACGSLDGPQCICNTILAT